MSAMIAETDRAAARSFVGGMAAEEAAKGLVESPEWDYDGATEVEKNYYRRFAVRCLARIEPLIAQFAADARAAERDACHDVVLTVANTTTRSHCDAAVRRAADAIAARRTP